MHGPCTHQSIVDAAWRAYCESNIVPCKYMHCASQVLSMQPARCRPSHVADLTGIPIHRNSLPATPQSSLGCQPVSAPRGTVAASWRFRVECSSKVDATLCYLSGSYAAIPLHRAAAAASLTWKMTLETSMRPMVAAPVKDATSAMTVAYAVVDG